VVYRLSACKNPLKVPVVAVSAPVDAAPAQERDPKLTNPETDRPTKLGEADVFRSWFTLPLTVSRVVPSVLTSRPSTVPDTAIFPVRLIPVAVRAATVNPPDPSRFAIVLAVAEVEIVASVDKTPVARTVTTRVPDPVRVECVTAPDVVRAVVEVAPRVEAGEPVSVPRVRVVNWTDAEVWRSWGVLRVIPPALFVTVTRFAVPVNVAATGTAPVLPINNCPLVNGPSAPRVVAEVQYGSLLAEAEPPLIVAADHEKLPDASLNNTVLALGTAEG
jgi:hypothetical protein